MYKHVILIINLHFVFLHGLPMDSTINPGIFAFANTPKITNSEEMIIIEDEYEIKNDPRTIISDIEKLRKVGEILLAVGEVVIPIIIESATKQQKLFDIPIIGDNKASLLLPVSHVRSNGVSILHSIKQAIDEIAKRTESSVI